MLSEYVHEHTQSVDRELREIAHSRPRYERPVADGRSRIRDVLRGLAFTPAKATPGAGGRPAGVVIRPATGADARAVERLAEASERRTPSGLVLVAEVDDDVVAALSVRERYVLTDLWRPTGDVVQLLELRSEQLRAADLEKVA
jgi:hypothetical protein